MIRYIVIGKQLPILAKTPKGFVLNRRYLVEDLRTGRVFTEVTLWHEKLKIGQELYLPDGAFLSEAFSADLE